MGPHGAAVHSEPWRLATVCNKQPTSGPVDLERSAILGLDQKVGTGMSVKTKGILTS